MIFLALVLDVVLVLGAFMILFLDKKNSAYFLSRNMKSFIMGMKAKSKIIKTALFFLYFMIYSGLLILFHYTYSLLYSNIALFLLIYLFAIVLWICFPFYFLKIVVWAKKICKV